MAANTSQVHVTVYSSTNVSTSAYTELFSSTPIACSKLEILDTSTKILKLAVGPDGSEVDICTIAVSGTIVVPYYIPQGSRISIKAIDATASSGYNVTSLLP
jgi:hypothetical protein